MFLHTWADRRFDNPNFAFVSLLIAENHSGVDKFRVNKNNSGRMRFNERGHPLQTDGLFH
jgi:hypothetical protein